jgi:UDP-glucose 4-epimerase
MLMVGKIQRNEGGSSLKVFISGGAGFIGSHLAEAYLKRGDEVVILDDFSTGSRQNLQPLLNHASFGRRIVVHEDTVLNAGRVRELVSGSDLVHHLAAAVGVQRILDQALDSLRTNLKGTETVLEACEAFRKPVLIASTSEAYGKQTHAPLVESDDITYGASSKLRWSYAAAKLVDEFLGLAYFRTSGLPVHIVRFFNTVGPRQTGRYGMVIPRFVSQALKSEPITVHGDGSQTRTFTHVREVVSAIVKLVETPQAAGEVVNIGGVEEVSILELARRVKSLAGSSSEISLTPYEKAYSADYEDMSRRVPSTAKLRKLIGFAPEMGLDAILKDVITYCRSM